MLNAYENLMKRHTPLSFCQKVKILFLLQVIIKPLVLCQLLLCLIRKYKGHINLLEKENTLLRAKNSILEKKQSLRSSSTKKQNQCLLHC